MSPAEKAARNFTRTRGKTAFRLFIQMLCEQKSGADIGKQFGVSRERVRQWKEIFGSTVSIYQPHAEVIRVIGGGNEH